MAEKGYDIVMEGVTYTYPRGKKPALEDIDLKVKRGEIVMVTGPTAAGKTTLCQCLNGLIPQYYRGKFNGNVLVKGMNTREYAISALSHICGLLFQDPSSQLIAPTVEDELAFGPENYHIPPEKIRVRVEEALEATGLKRYRDRSPFSLSEGEQQTCAIASIMTMRPDIFVLDEPTSNLDPVGSSRVLRLITQLARRREKTMVIVEHKMEEMLPLVDRIIVMNEGRIVADGEPQVILNKVEALEELGLRQPQVNSLALRLKKSGIEIDPTFLTFEDAVKAFLGILRGREGAWSDREGVRKLKSILNKPARPIIEVRNLHYSYEKGSVALRGINLTVREGDFMAIIGRNGSGKTTLVKHFVGLLKPTEGDVFVYGVNTKAATVYELAQKVGYCFQNPDHQICCKSVREELEFGPRNLGLPDDEVERRVDEISREMGLERLLDRSPYSLSRGEKRRVAIASVLTMGPETLVVDEPTTGQDKRMGEEMMKILRSLHSRGKTVILITHDMELVAEYVDRVVVLRDGEVIFDGATADAFSQPKLLETTSLRPPQITRLGYALRGYGISTPVLRVDEMYDEFVTILGG